MVLKLTHFGQQMTPANQQYFFKTASFTQLNLYEYAEGTGVLENSTCFEDICNLPCCIENTLA